jgi:hypothetical protein
VYCYCVYICSLVGGGSSLSDSSQQPAASSHLKRMEAMDPGQASLACRVSRPSPFRHRRSGSRNCPPECHGHGRGRPGAPAATYFDTVECCPRGCLAILHVWVNCAASHPSKKDHRGEKRLPSTASISGRRHFRLLPLRCRRRVADSPRATTC